MTEKINHPPHYGGDVPYEAIKVIENWGLGFSAGNAVKYILRAKHKGSEADDLKKALWYLNRAYASGEPRYTPWGQGSVERRVPANEVAKYWKLDFLLGACLYHIERGESYSAWDCLRRYIAGEVA